MTKKWTPFAVQSVATENGWSAREYDTFGGTAASFGCGLGPRFVFSRRIEDSEKPSSATVHVVYRPDGGMLAAWLHIHKREQNAWSGGDWYMLDHKASGKRDIVIRWLAGDFAAGGLALQ